MDAIHRTASGPSVHRAGLVGRSSRGCFLGPASARSRELPGGSFGSSWALPGGILVLPGAFLNRFRVLLGTSCGFTECKHRKQL
eukprot:3629947-Pyramimonas_sp.AAC.1